LPDTTTFDFATGQPIVQSSSNNLQIAQMFSAVVAEQSHNTSLENGKAGDAGITGTTADQVNFGGVNSRKRNLESGDVWGGDSTAGGGLTGQTVHSAVPERATAGAGEDQPTQKEAKKVKR
jgi:hypothetical protein